MGMGTLFLGLITFSSLIFAFSPVNAEESISIENKTMSSSESADIKVTTFGMFDAEDDGALVHQLFVGEKYWFNIEYQNELETIHDIGVLVQMIDKNKTEDNVLRKIEGHSFLESSEGLVDGFEWTPSYAGQFKITAEFTVLDDPLVGSVVPQYDFVVVDRPSLKQQLKKITPINDIICKNENHHLVERANGKLACVYLDTAEKLDWKSVAK
jgi:hypothetical protein